MLHTRKRVLLIDNLATVLITVVGLGVIIAVAGMMAFLISSSWPLFQSEKFERTGQLAYSSETQALFIDEVAPLAVLFPRASQNCIIQTQVVHTNAGPSASTPNNWRLDQQTNPSDNSISFALNAVQSLSKNTHSDSSPTAPLSCTGDEQGNLLVRSGTSLFSLSPQIVREFLSSEEVRKLTPEARNQLNEKKWTQLSVNSFLVKTSAQSPTAQLKLQFETNWEVKSFFKDFPESSLETLKFIRRPDKKDGVLLSQSGLPSGRAEAQLLILTTAENSITGEKSTSLQNINLSQKIATRDGYEILSPAWIEGRYLVVPLADLSVASIDTEDANFKAVKLLPKAEYGKIVSWTPTFGGAAALAEMRPANSPEETKCVYLDVGRATRLANSSAQGAAEIPVLWADNCSPALKTFAHPHKRVAYRIIQSTSTDRHTLEARELTTGRLAATTPLPAKSFDSLIFETHGNRMMWKAEGEDHFEVHDFKAPHVEVSLRSLFDKIRYESYETASYSWQSTSGSDEFQAKFSLVPLIWGTFKATLYSLLFAVPLAIFAAVYSSEILDRQTRNVVKPTLEMMASVPSVVLGFLAAIVVAPWIEAHIVSVLLIGTSMPFLLYLFGVFLQVPSARHLTARGLYASRRLLMWVIVGFILLLWVLIRAGLWIERTAFGGDLKAFLSGGTGTEGVLWGLLLLPIVLISLWSLPIRRAKNWYRIAVFVVGPFIAVGIGSLLAGHTELRSDLLGQYAQRNTLVIAIAMGFAIIPIIYSLAEDALTSVPNSLRAGSLACGASVWQTTARVVLPTAASGLFSAVMVGLGRGIGETMIAVMATGNTAVMTTNPFDGLRSMAANIAVELPEAAQGSTHYRILFLSALTLFLFTFTLNSFAEFLRARYRDRNKAL